MIIRQKQLCSVIKEEVALYINTHINIRGIIISISYVDSNEDGSRISVSYVIFPDNPIFHHRIENKLKQVRVSIQNIISQKHQLRNTPIIEFKLDKQSNVINRVDKLLNEIKNEGHK